MTTCILTPGLAPGRKSIWSNLWQKFDDRNTKVREGKQNKQKKKKWKNIPTKEEKKLQKPKDMMTAYSLSFQAFFEKLIKKPRPK